MPLVQLERVSFWNPDEEQPALDDISLELNPGDFALLLGPTGCGKTTLFQVLAGIIPAATGGRIRGRVLIDGSDILRDDDKKRGVVGLILQDPEVQMTSLYVEDEVAFGPENLCLLEETIHDRVDEALQYARLDHLRKALIYPLSGGQKQRVAIAAGLAMRPRVLLMDGPTTNLDPAGAGEVLQLITRLRETGETEAVLIAANKIDALLPLATRIIVMDGGRIIFDASPEEVVLDHIDLLHEIGVFIPELALITARLNAPEYARRGKSLPGLPREVNQAIEMLRPLHLDMPALPDATPVTSEPVIELDNVHFGYDGREVLRGLSLTVHRGESLAIVGQNGSGKTTMVKLIAGLRTPQAGAIRVGGKLTQEASPLGRVGYVFQYPVHQFVAQTVEEELAFSLRRLELADGESARMVDETLELFGLTDKRLQPPYILSMGEKRWLSVATMTIMRPEILILDEPTTGLDRRSTDALMRLLDAMVRDHGITLIQVSHDMEQIAEFSSRVVALDGGRLVFDDTPRALFSNHAVLASCQLAAPPVARVAQGLWPDRERTPITIGEFFGDGLALPPSAAAAPGEEE